MIRISKCILAAISLLAWLQAGAQTHSAGDPLFADDSTLEVTITAPFATLVRERPTEEYIPGTFQYADENGEAVTHDVGLRTRGHFRYQTCGFPPLRVNFKKGAVRGTLFDGQDKLKMVVPCETQARYEQYVLREYLAYRVFNLLTDTSFRVRLLRVRFVDSEGKRKDLERYAYFIEHKKRLAKRLGIPILNIEEVETEQLDGEYLNLTSIFQYFVANTDFSPIAGPPDSNCCHNYVLFQPKEGALVTAVPYDFDQAGFVDAPYASPDSRMRIRRVTQRAYRGRCAFNDNVAGSIDAFTTMREPIYEMIASQEGASDRVKKTLKKFVDKFYAVVEDPGRVERVILGACVG